ncbi:MAG: hypothetical protein Q7T74_04780 [Candidatus Saccharibacteria bacterium]|nr:hypothetical protein [Candidatus Saccharibacteria bacterium]
MNWFADKPATEDKRGELLDFVVNLQANNSDISHEASAEVIRLSDEAAKRQNSQSDNPLAGMDAAWRASTALHEASKNAPAYRITEPGR